mgnify:CR=1 FL=1
MAENNKQYDDNTEYDAFQEAIRYGTIETTALFEPDNRSFKISAGGGSINYRIRYASIIGACLFLFVGIAITLLLIFIFGFSPYAIPFILVINGVLFLIGAKVGTMSPMEKTTGEDLITYIFMMLRRNIATRNSILSMKRPSKVKLNSLAINKTNGGRIVDCETFLGTQPLYDAPPINPYDFNEMSEFFFDPQGEFKTIPSEKYKDGLNRKR